MTDIPRSPALHGDAYRAALDSCEAMPPWLVEHLLAEDASFMLCSDGSIGKSTISINAAASMSAGTPVWGQFLCPKPLRVYYLIGERDIREPLRRLKRISEGDVLANPDNFWLSDSFSGTCNLLDDKHGDELVKAVLRDCPEGPDVLFFDPLYSFVAGALSEDRTGNLLTRCFSRIKKELGCAMWITHHNVKFRIDDSGKQVRANNPMYGSVWLFNHVTTQYLIERETPSRVLLKRSKDNWGCQLPMIPLDYNPDNDVVTMDGEMGPRKKTERVQTFLLERKARKMSFTKAELVGATGVTDSQLSRILSEPPWRGKVKNSSPNGKPGLYTVVD